MHRTSTKNHGGIKVNPSALWLAHGFGQIGPTQPYYEFVDDLLFLGCDTNDVELIHNIVDSVESNTTYSETQMTSPAEKSSSESPV